MKQFLLLSFYIFLFVLLPLTKTLPQEEDPWGINSTGPRTVKSQDVFLLFMNNGGGEINQKIYRAKPEALANPSDDPDFINNMISETETKVDTRKGSDRQVDVATGRFNVDPYDDVVAVWRTLGNDHKIEISIPAFDSTGIFQSSFKYTLDAGERIRLDDHIYVRTGDFDGDGLDEFVVTVLNLSNHIRYFIFDVDTTNGMLQPVLIHNYTSQHTVTDDQIKTEKRVRYIIETADLNSDGIDEIVSFTHEGDIPSNNIFIPAKCRVYTIENDVIVPKGTQDLHLYKSVANYQITMAVAKGQLIPGPNEELVFCSVTSGGQTFPTTSSVHFAHLFIIDATADLQTIHQHDKIIDLEDPSFNHNCRPITDFGLATGDLDLDSNGRDEIVYIAGERIRIAKIEDNTSITLKGSILIANGGPYDYTQSDNYIKVKDVNMDNREDIIVVKHLTQDATNLPKGFATYFITMDNSLEKPDVLGRLLNDENENYNYRKYAIAVGNFDGLDFKVGYPYPKVTVLGLKQPIVLLNAPPTHFDKFGNDIFDVNGCFNGNNCNFTATYQHTQGNTMEVNTSVHRDWMISGGFKVSGSVGAGTTLNYEAHLLLNYGEHYSKDSTHRTTISSSTSVHTTGDDQIFYTSTDYDFWEYPIYHDNETFPRRSFLVADPKHTEGAWTNSKSVNSVNYVPDHEVGNILSYSDDVTSNPYVGDTIRVQYGSTTFVINNNSSFGWDLVHNDFTTNNTETTKEVGASLGFSYGLEFNGDYSQSTMETHTTTVENETHLHIDLGSTDLAIPQTDYKVLPYAYWSTNGVLAVDYTVNPVLGQPGGFETWWQAMYGDNPDPTFILPWKFDPEKGIGLIDETQRFYTQDIIFSDKDPDPGDTLTITARVRNFSLMPTLIPVTTKFYLNDPDSGGTEIIGISGTNTASTDGPVAARGRSDAEFKWIVPSGLPQYPRIYAILDKDNTIPEIHEENNKGLNILRLGIISDIEEDNYIVPEEYTLYQSYPNPFNPSTTIKYSIPKSDKVSIKVYDILGSEVTLLTNEYKPAGTYSVEFNASRFASGVYFYQIHAGNFLETKKMVLLK